jgi:quercetin dioxygenase-like cupin family protein
MKTKKEENIIQQKIASHFKRTIVQPHSHPHEQITYLAEGELFFYKDGTEYHLKKGDIITIPADVPHCIRTLSAEARLIDSFSPIRRDFLL